MDLNLVDTDFDEASLQAELDSLKPRGDALRIAVVAPPWFEIPPRGYGGIEAMCHGLVEGLTARGHEVVLIGVGRDKTSARFVRTLEEPPSDRLGESLPEVLHATMAGRALSELDVDVLHDNSLAGPLLAFGSRVPTLVTTTACGCRKPDRRRSAGNGICLSSRVRASACTRSRR